MTCRHFKPQQAIRRPPKVAAAEAPRWRVPPWILQPGDSPGTLPERSSWGGDDNMVHIRPIVPQMVLGADGPIQSRRDFLHPARLVPVQASVVRRLLSRGCAAEDVRRYEFVQVATDRCEANLYISGMQSAGGSVPGAGESGSPGRCSSTLKAVGSSVRCCSTTGDVSDR